MKTELGARRNAYKWNYLIIKLELYWVKTNEKKIEFKGEDSPTKPKHNIGVCMKIYKYLCIKIESTNANRQIFVFLYYLV